jgi:predicted nucleic acid-binding Zn ribbon protein
VKESGRPPRREPEALSALIPGVLAEMGLDQASLGIELLRVWSSALGEELSPHCSAEGIRRGVVHASVRDSAWMQRIQLEKPRILARLREALGPEAALDLRLHIGRGT